MNRRTFRGTLTGGERRGEEAAGQGAKDWVPPTWTKPSRAV